MRIAQTNPYINFEYKILLALGAWPFQEPIQTVIRTTIVSLIVGSMGAFVILGYAKVCCPFHIIAEMIPFITISISFAGKYIATYYSAKKLRYIYKHMERDWASLATGEERTMAEELAERGRRYNLNFAKILYCFECGYCVSPFSSIILDVILPMNKSRPLQQLFRVEYYIDQEKYYFVIYLHLCIATTIGVTVAVATDVMYLSKVHHARGLFRLAGYRLQLALTESAKKTYVDFGIVPLKRIIVGIESHKRAINFCTSIYEVYQMPHILLAITGVFGITISMFCTAAYFDQLEMMIIYSLLLVAQISYAWFLMYPVQLMSDESAQIFYRIYNARWYVAPLPVQKIIVTLLIRTKYPTKVVFGKLLPVTMETFSNIVQTAISYCTVLYSIS